MDKTPTLPRKSLSLTTRLRNRTSGSPVQRIRNSFLHSSPISSHGNSNVTTPIRKYSSDVTASPTNDFDFSPKSTFSHSSTNSPEVTWRWTQDDTAKNQSPSSMQTKSMPIRMDGDEGKKKRSSDRKREQRKADMENRKAKRNRRNLVLKQQCEKMELLISKQAPGPAPAPDSAKSDESPLASKERSLSNSSGYGSNNNINAVIDLLNDSESDCLLLEATQKAETSFERNKNHCMKDLEKSFTENGQRSKPTVSELLQDSLDDWFASLDSNLLEAKPKTSFQRHNSMPIDSPIIVKKPDTAKIKRYQSSGTLSPKSTLPKHASIFKLLKQKLRENQTRVRYRKFGCFQKWKQDDDIL